MAERKRMQATNAYEKWKSDPNNIEAWKELVAIPPAYRPEEANAVIIPRQMTAKQLDSNYVPEQRNSITDIAVANTRDAVKRLGQPASRPGWIPAVREWASGVADVLGNAIGAVDAALYEGAYGPHGVSAPQFMQPSPQNVQSQQAVAPVGNPALMQQDQQIRNNLAPMQPAMAGVANAPMQPAMAGVAPADRFQQLETTVLGQRIGSADKRAVKLSDDSDFAKYTAARQALLGQHGEQMARGFISEQTPGSMNEARRRRTDIDQGHIGAYATNARGELLSMPKMQDPNYFAGRALTEAERRMSPQAKQEATQKWRDFYAAPATKEYQERIANMREEQARRSPALGVRGQQYQKDMVREGMKFSERQAVVREAEQTAKESFANRRDLQESYVKMSKAIADQDSKAFQTQVDNTFTIIGRRMSDDKETTAKINDIKTLISAIENPEDKMNWMKSILSAESFNDPTVLKKAIDDMYGALDTLTQQNLRK